MWGWRATAQSVSRALDAVSKCCCIRSTIFFKGECIFQLQLEDSVRNQASVYAMMAFQASTALKISMVSMEWDKFDGEGEEGMSKEHYFII